MEDQIGLADCMRQFPSVNNARWSDVVGLERASAVCAKVIARIDVTPAEPTRLLGEPGQRQSKELAQDEAGPEMAHELSDRGQARFRPRLQR
jgi:hypothetical protein